MKLDQTSTSWKALLTISSSSVTVLCTTRVRQFLPAFASVVKMFATHTFLFHLDFQNDWTPTMVETWLQSKLRRGQFPVAQLTCPTHRGRLHVSPSSNHMVPDKIFLQSVNWSHRFFTAELWHNSTSQPFRCRHSRPRQKPYGICSAVTMTDDGRIVSLAWLRRLLNKPLRVHLGQSMIVLDRWINARTLLHLLPQVPPCLSFPLTIRTNTEISDELVHVLMNNLSAYDTNP